MQVMERRKIQGEERTRASRVQRKKRNNLIENKRQMGDTAQNEPEIFSKEQRTENK